MNFTRRDFTKIGLAALPAAILAKPNSRFGGVQIGINVPYSFRAMPGSADDILRNVLQLELSSVELRSPPVENFLGGPISAQPPGGARKRRGAALKSRTGADSQQGRRRAAEVAPRPTR